ncbi:MAG: [FeFe] hydrogenase H-cluster radical SAM maturase HydE [Syntrophales bacterium]|nr:[FeFe] hydrogenase H-cluster radical SAM maturase HydE [Syntrophales bacterium]
MSEPISESALIHKALDGESLTRGEITRLLSLSREEGQQDLFRAADETRRHYVGDEIFFRGIIEFSNLCERDCLYCGLRRSNRRLGRYRMPEEEILVTARRIRDEGVGTVVLQSGEDPFFTTEKLADLIGRIREETGLVVTLSVGERPLADYQAFREAGSSRYLLKYETASSDLYRRLRPGSFLADRLLCLKALSESGYEVGTGNMVGLPCQSLETLADDLLLMRDLHADMLGIGPFLPHPETPLAAFPAGDLALTLKVLAVARLLTRTTNIPATTALGNLDPRGRLMALQAGANVVMPDFTPPVYRDLYEIYPGRNKTEDASVFLNRLKIDIARMGRTVGRGAGSASARRADTLA